MLNLIFWKKVQGQKHPGRWGIIGHQIPSIKVLFKTNTKSHKHLCIKLLSSQSKTQLVNQRKQKVAFNPGTAHSPVIQSYRMWWCAASPIPNATPVVCICKSYNRTHIENAHIYINIYIYIYINTELLDGNKGHQEENWVTLKLNSQRIWILLWATGPRDTLWCEEFTMTLPIARPGIRSLWIKQRNHAFISATVSLWIASGPVRFASIWLHPHNK